VAIVVSFDICTSSIDSITSDLASGLSNSIKDNDLFFMSDRASKVDAIADEVAWRAALKEDRVFDLCSMVS